jgi:PPP family 3-phenylpropionic acid transporter
MLPIPSGVVRAVQSVFVLAGVALATIAPFIPVMLRERGLDPAAVGLVAAASALGFTLAVPVWGHLADVTYGRARTLQVAALGAALSMIAFGLPVPGIVLGLMVIGYNVFQSALGPLSDALAVGMLGDRMHDYGRIRYLSSLAYGLAVVAIGFLYDRTGFGLAPFLWALSLVVLVGALFFVRQPRPAALVGVHRRGGSARLALAVQPRLPLVLLTFGLLFFAILGSYTFFNIRLVEVGGKPSDIALGGGLAALAEVPGVLLGARIVRRVGLRGLFVGSAIWYSIGILTWALLDQPPMMIASRFLTGFAFGGLWVACVLTMGFLLPRTLQATGQALYQTTTFGIAAIVANALGGVVYQELGPPILFAGAAVVGFGSAALGWPVLPAVGERPAQLDEVVAPDVAVTAAAP